MYYLDETNKEKAKFFAEEQKKIESDPEYRENVIGQIKNHYKNPNTKKWITPRDEYIGFAMMAIYFDD